MYRCGFKSKGHPPLDSHHDRSTVKSERFAFLYFTRKSISIDLGDKAIGRPMPELNPAERLAEQVKRMQAAASQPLVDPLDPVDTPDGLDPLMFHIASHDLRDEHRVALEVKTSYDPRVAPPPSNIARCLCGKSWELTPAQLQMLKVELRYCICLNVKSIQPYMTFRGSTLVRTVIRCMTCQREIDNEDYTITLEGVSSVGVELTGDAIRDARILKIKKSTVDGTPA